MDAETERQLRDMLDRDAIWQVVQQLGRALDRMDHALIRDCYHPEAIDDHGRFVGGVEDFIAYAEDVAAAYLSSQHGLLNHLCELDGDDAYSETYYMFTGIRAEPPHMLSTGRYVDHFQRRGGRWRIANRITVIERNLEAADNAFSPALPMDAPDTQPSRRDRGDVSYHRPPRPRALRKP